MDKDKVIEIYQRVRELTTANKLKWQGGDKNEKDGFICFMGNYRILLIRGGSIFIHFQIVDEKGLQIGSLSSGLQDQYDLEGFIELVYRKTSGIDDKLDDFLNQLNKL